MNILIYTGVLSRKAGGLYYSVSGLAKSIISDGCDVVLTGFEDKYTQEDVTIYRGVQVKKYRCLWPFRKAGLSYDVNRIMKRFAPDIIHQQGIWSFLSLHTVIYKYIHGNCKTIITPRGMLDGWIIRRSPIKKWIVRKLFEDANMRNADCMHALCKSEYISMRKYGLKNPIAIIPNGVNIPYWNRDYQLFRNKDVRTMLFLSRLHPKKGVIELIKAYALIKENYPDIIKKWKLKIGGWGEETFIKEIKSFINLYGLENDIELLGAVYGNEKDKLLKDVDAFILPTYSEGLPMAVLEAWAYGLPVITTDYSNLPESFDYGAAFRVENDVRNLKKGLSSFLMKDDDEIISYGKKGYELVTRQFSWDAIGIKLRNLYDWLCGKADKPDFVYMD